MRSSVTPVETKVAQLPVVGGYVAVLHLTIGSVSRITTLPVALSTVYVSVSAGSPVPPELMKNAWVGAYAFALSICSSERVGVVRESARPRPALQANVTVVLARYEPG